MNRHAPLVLSVLLFSACTTASVKEEEDVLAGLTPGSYRNLDVALVLSKNSKEGMKSRASRGTCLAGWDPEKWFNDSIEVIERNFRTVARADTIEEAKAANPDLLVVLDNLAVHHCFRVALDIKLSAIFMTPDQKVLDTVVGENKKGHSKYNSSWNYITGSYGRVFAPVHRDAAVAEALAFFERALISSRKLNEFASSRTGPAAPVAVPAEYPELRSDIDAPAYRLDEAPANFALVVGIGKYKDLPDAQFASRDAAAVRDHLLALGYPRRNVIVLRDQDATRTGLQKYLEEWLPRNVQPESTVFFYYSGHGAPDVNSGEAYLVPWDGDAQFLQSTAYPVRQLYESLNRLKAGRVIAALDSCFSGAGGRSVLAKGARPLVTKVDAGIGSVGSMVVFSASGADEISGSDETQGHGLFTYHFLKGLGGAARDKGGKVTVRGLYDYLLPKVQDGARRQNREQTPRLLPSDLGERAGLELRSR